MASARPALIALSMLASLGLVALAPPAPEHEPGPVEGDRLTRPATVVLDFRDRPVSEVVAAIAGRTGRKVIAQRAAMTKGFNVNVNRANDADWRERGVRLTAPAAVPFWEAIDRLADAAKVGYRLADFGDTGAATTGVQFDGTGEPPGLAVYSGPFRVGLIGVHEHHDHLFIRGPWVKLNPSGFKVEADAAELGSAPLDGGPLYAEIQAAAEPGLVCRLDGGLTGLEAADGAGRPLLAPALAPKKNAGATTRFAAFSAGLSPPLRVPLHRPDAASKTIGRLRGAIPVEVSMVRAAPALVIPLEGSEGKTFRGGGAEFTVRTVKTESDGRMTVALSGRLTGEMEPALRYTRTNQLQSHQARVVDAGGKPVRFGSSSSGGDNGGGLYFTYQYTPGVGTSPPAEFRYHDVDRAAWQIPFEFHDVPLP